MSFSYAHIQRHTHLKLENQEEKNSITNTVKQAHAHIPTGKIEIVYTCTSLLPSTKNL